LAFQSPSELAYRNTLQLTWTDFYTFMSVKLLFTADKNLQQQAYTT